MLNVAKSKALPCIALMAMLSGCGSAALIIYNDTKKTVDVDVIRKDSPRGPYFRLLRSGLAFNSKSCSHEISKIYIRDGSSEISIDPKSICSDDCECRVNVSEVEKEKLKD